MIFWLCAGLCVRLRERASTRETKRQRGTSEPAEAERGREAERSRRLKEVNKNMKIAHENVRLLKSGDDDSNVKNKDIAHDNVRLLIIIGNDIRRLLKSDGDIEMIKKPSKNCQKIIKK